MKNAPVTKSPIRGPSSLDIEPGSAKGPGLIPNPDPGACQAPKKGSGP